ncbi:MAG: HAMP domain-containing protein [Nitrospirota bacterium]|nr:MAG: HAMP domain-containing protein [Nitrospirota bacterium]
MRWTLNKKLVSMMVVLSSLLIIIMYIFNQYYEEQLFDTLKEKSRDLVRSFQLSVEEMTKKDHDDMKLLSFLEEVRSEGISEINIIDSALKISESTDPFKIGDELSDNVTELIFQSEEGRLITENGDLFNVIVPVVVKGEHQGYIHMIIDSRDIQSFLDQNVKRRLGAAALLLFTGIVIAIWLSTRYTRPIKQVVHAARSVAAGDLDVNLRVNEKDEIGELKESFNQMIDRLIELRHLRDRLRETEHLSTVGELASSVAHEVRNPLNFISLSVDHLMDKSAESASTDLLMKIKKEIKRLDSLVENFLAYGRPLKIVPKTANLIQVVEETLSLVYARAEKVGIKIDRIYDPLGSIEIRMDAELIKTCILNIVQNSFQAMPDGGTLAIELSEDGEKITVKISDTGKGIGPEKAGKVFEPFFTTREGGLGLGLAITKRVVGEHGGRIYFSSEKDGGSVVSFVIPLDPNRKRTEG